MKIKNNNFYPLPKEYTDVIDSLKSYDIAIVGKDPYPTDPIGIPFCKSNWNDLFANNSSGKNVLISLGVNIEEVALQYTPIEYFLYLAKEKRIIFLNLSYHFLDGACRKSKHVEYLKIAENINQKYLLKSKIIILCGEAKKIKWYSGTYNNMSRTVYPDNRCKISKYNFVKEEWKQRWTKNSLKNEFKLDM